jgi:sodium-coupled neutral amino acid transporter 9
MFVLRKQAFLFMIDREQENLLPIITLNIVVLTTCILFACFYPSIGTILRFSGAISGFVILFLLPCLVHMQFQRKEKQLAKLSIVGHSVIILLGLANLVAQFTFF